MRHILTFFSLLLVSFSFAQVTTVGIIGTATPIGDWDTDVDMVQSATDTSMWTLSVTLGDGAMKFRANDAWELNWGNNDNKIPFGTGIQAEGDFILPAGDYNITFNHVTGAYFFDVITDIGIIGTATPIGDWDTDVNMFRDTSDAGKFYVTLDLAQGPCKFRKDDDFAVNWGNNNSDFPSGAANINEGDINIPKAGSYYIELDTTAKTYSFEEKFSFASIGVVGTGTSLMSLTEDVDLNQSATDPNVWSANLDFVDGTVQFRANDTTELVWGAMDFPSGVAVLGSTETVPVTAGTYLTTFNTETGAYSFAEVIEYTSIGIIGDGSPIGDWDTEVPMEQSLTDPHMWLLRAQLADGELKFRANNDWAAGSWGAADFPSGIAEFNGTTNIPITGGDYIISFNSISGAYNFEEVVEYNSVGLIGLMSPNMDWETDIPMEKSSEDFNLWTLNSVTLTTADPDVDDNGVKFRVDAAWDINWGDLAWPNGVGTMGGPNVKCVAGTYSVAFNSLSGEYLFGPAITSTEEIVNPSSVALYPNPAQNSIELNLESVEMTGDAKLSILNMSGQVVFSEVRAVENIMTIDVTQLQNGNFILQLVGDNHVIGKKFSVIK